MNCSKIESSKISKYQFKEQFFTLLPVFLVILGIALFGGLIGGKIWLGLGMLYSGFFLLILLYTGVVNYFRSGIAKNTTWTVSETGISIQIDRNQLNLLSQMRLKKLERVGKGNFFIPWNQVKSVKSKKRGIQIYSQNYSLWNGSGTILIPHELEHYDLFQKTLREKLPKSAFV